MKSTASLSLILLMACSAAPIGTNETPDDFVRAATSWEGSDVRNMIQVWGFPHEATRDAAGAGAGVARWRFGENQAACLGQISASIPEATCRSDPLSNTKQFCPRRGVTHMPVATAECNKLRKRSNHLRHRCVITASFTDDGIITEIKAYSKRCSEAYADDLSTLSR